MHRNPDLALKTPLLLLSGLGLTAMMAAAFYGWLNFGSGIFLTLAENGLSWCF